MSALLDDLSERGMLDDVLIVMAGEFGRTPKVFVGPASKSGLAGRDHWARSSPCSSPAAGSREAQSLGRPTGSRLPVAGPAEAREHGGDDLPGLGLPDTIAWKDSLDRPHFVYQGDPIRGLT